MLYDDVYVKKNFIFNPGDIHFFYENKARGEIGAQAVQYPRARNDDVKCRGICSRDDGNVSC